MADDNELAKDEVLGIPEAAREIWSALTTSQKLRAISPEHAKAYKLQLEIYEAVMQIQAAEQERKRRDPWKFLRNLCKYIIGEIDSRS